VRVSTQRCGNSAATLLPNPTHGCWFSTQACSKHPPMSTSRSQTAYCGRYSSYKKEHRARNVGRCSHLSGLSSGLGTEYIERRDLGHRTTHCGRYSSYRNEYRARNLGRSRAVRLRYRNQAEAMGRPAAKSMRPGTPTMRVSTRWGPASTESRYILLEEDTAAVPCLLYMWLHVTSIAMCWGRLFDV
jgi:hypothetical protein